MHPGKQDVQISEAVDSLRDLDIRGTWVVKIYTIQPNNQ